MAQILLLSPSLILTERAQKLVFEKGLENTVDIQTVSISEVENIVKSAERKDIKVIISRAGMAYTISTLCCLPIIEIRQTISSYVEILAQLNKYEGKIGFFSVPEFQEQTKALCSLLGIDAQYYRFTDEVSAQKVIRQAIKEGCIVGVGGVLTGKFASLLGLDYVALENSYTDIEAALDNALQLLNSIKDNESRNRELQLRIQRYEAIFNYTHDGIIAVDKDGKVVIINKQAEAMLPLENKPYEGKSIDKVLRETKLLTVLKNGRPELDELMKVKNTIITTNRIPILVDGHVEGVVATFKDIESIQTTEWKIRTNLYKKGLVAKYKFNDLLGESRIFQRVTAIGKSYAKSEANILLIGEIGTGKEMLAHCIHNESRRRKKPFVVLNCANYTIAQLRVQILGYDKEERSTRKTDNQVGVFELAHGGTLFLDKIHEAPREIQNLLLGIIESKEVRRIGSEQVIPIDVRVISSVNGLHEEITSENFLTEELMYVLSVLILRIPPLRERENDYILLCDHFFQKILGADYRKYQIQISEIIELLGGFKWRGNIRQLINIVERSSVLLQHGMTVEAIESTLPIQVIENNSRSEKQKEIALDKWSKSAIVSALTANHLNISRTAKFLGCSRSTLYKKMEQFNIKIENI